MKIKILWDAGWEMGLSWGLVLEREGKRKGRRKTCISALHILYRPTVYVHCFKDIRKGATRVRVGRWESSTVSTENYRNKMLINSHVFSAICHLGVLVLH